MTLNLPLPFLSKRPFHCRFLISLFKNATRKFMQYFQGSHMDENESVKCASRENGAHVLPV